MQRSLKYVCIKKVQKEEGKGMEIKEWVCRRPREGT